MENNKQNTSEENTPIYLRNRPFPMEIFDHPSLISLTAKYYKPKLFVELGTGTGECTKKYIDDCGMVCGVDMNRKVIKEVEERKNFLFFQMTTDDFINNELNEITKKYGNIEMCFIDADHAFESVRKDFIGIYSKLCEGGIIFLHDTFPCNQFCTSPTFCNDAYKISSWIKEEIRKGLNCEIFTFPIQPGLTLVRKCWTSEEWGGKIDKGN
jgi:predicted O-methyltransferase YrrM